MDRQDDHWDAEPEQSGEGIYVPAGEDRYGEPCDLDISVVTFKLTPADGPDLLVLEHVFHAPGGPVRHVHHYQHELFRVLDGEFRFEVGEDSRTLGPGDVMLGPRGVPHAWACSGAGGRILITFSPAGDLEQFFRELARAGGLASGEPEVRRRYGMDVLGPPLTLEPDRG